MSMEAARAPGVEMILFRKHLTVTKSAALVGYIEWTSYNNSNPKGSITNNDLKLAEAVVHPDVIVM
jgi:hypothetical protein